VKRVLRTLSRSSFPVTASSAPTGAWPAIAGASIASARSYRRNKKRRRSPALSFTRRLVTVSRRVRAERTARTIEATIRKNRDCHESRLFWWKRSLAQRRAWSFKMLECFSRRSTRTSATTNFGASGKLFPERDKIEISIPMEPRRRSTTQRSRPVS
jgi:hypothetical protein